MAIKFYKVRNEVYGAFSNFSNHPFVAEGKSWKTSEHYFQTMKFLDEDIQEKVRMTSTAGDSARMGRDRSLPLRKDWEVVKDGIMLDAIRFKFSQHDDIRELLLSTGDEELIEDSPKDYYWGCGKDGSGKNMLGKLLVKLRDEFKL